MRQGRIVWTFTMTQRGAIVARYAINVIVIMTTSDPFVILQFQLSTARVQNSDDPFSADELDSLTSFPSSSQPELAQTQERGRGQAKRSHRNSESSPSPSLRRPRFGSDWDLPRLRPRKQAESESLPLQLDSHGRPKGLLQCGPRVRVKTK
jgi:hypothetical protein